MPPVVCKFLHTRMRVSDLEKSVNFYKETFGLEVSRSHESPRGSKLVFLSVPNSEEEIELTYFPGSGTVEVQEDLMHLAFQVESMSDFQIHLESIGQSFSEGPTESSSGSVLRLWMLLMDMRLKSLNDLKSDLPHFLLTMKNLTIFLILSFLFYGCMPEKNLGTTNFKQRNVVVQWL